MLVELGTPLQAAIKQSLSSRPMLLATFATNRIPGGFYKNGGIGLEETICRCTNIGQVMSHWPELYPINANDASTSNALYIPEVLVLRQDVDPYLFLTKRSRPRISVCLIPTLDKDTPNSPSNDSAVLAMLKERIALQFEVADSCNAVILVAKVFRFG